LLQADHLWETINYAENLAHAVRDLCGWVAVELEVNGLLAVTSTAFAVGAAFA